MYDNTKSLVIPGSGAYKFNGYKVYDSTKSLVIPGGVEYGPFSGAVYDSTKSLVIPGFYLSCMISIPFLYKIEFFILYT